jgi:hypothetical protein
LTRVEHSIATASGQERQLGAIQDRDARRRPDANIETQRQLDAMHETRAPRRLEDRGLHVMGQLDVVKIETSEIEVACYMDIDGSSTP